MALAVRSYGSLRYEAGKTGARWVLDDIPPHVAIRLKHIFPRIPKSATSPFSLATDLATARDLAWFIDRYPLAVSNVDLMTLETATRTFEAKANEIEGLLSMDFQSPAYGSFREGWGPRGYQAQVVEMLRRSRGLLCGDVGGLGKTMVGAASMMLPGALPAAVVMQPHLQGQWMERLQQYTTLRIHPIKGTKPYQLPEADAYLWRYTQLVGWVDVFKHATPRLAIWDEIQELRTGVGTDSDPVLKGMAALELAAGARMNLGLTGTPIMGYGVEIWNVMRYLRPEVLGEWDDFRREWAPSGRLRDPKALGSFLREQHAFIRRTKKDVGMEMPKVSRITQSVDYDEQAIHDAEKLARQLAIKATTGSFHDRGQATRELDLYMRQQTGIAKARKVADFVRILVEGGTPVILAGWHREVYAIWLKELEDLKPAMFTGSESSTRKDKEKQRFLSGETDLFIISLRSGAGLDGLQLRCSTMVIGELDWSPGIHQQLIWRIDRDGQLEPVTVFFMVTDAGSDPVLIEINGLKASEAQGVVDPDLGVVINEPDESVLRKLVARYLDKTALAQSQKPDTESAGRPHP